MLVYVLWREVLTRETKTSLDALKDWPLLPAVSAGRRLLLSPDMAVHLFETVPTPFQVLWSGVEWSVVLYCVVWCGGVVEYLIVWYGMAWYGME